jgi:hypothetical protein
LRSGPTRTAKARRGRKRFGQAFAKLFLGELAGFGGVPFGPPLFRECAQFLGGDLVILVCVGENLDRLGEEHFRAEAAARTARAPSAAFTDRQAIRLVGELLGHGGVPRRHESLDRFGRLAEAEAAGTTGSPSATRRSAERAAINALGFEGFPLARREVEFHLPNAVQGKQVGRALGRFGPGGKGEQGQSGRRFSVSDYSGAKTDRSENSYRPVAER